MKCLRCGHCCHNYFVIIVDNPEKGIEEGNLILHEGNGQPCKHLLGDKPGNYTCSIHNKPYYKETPCYKHTQIERSVDEECRIGRYILNNKKTVRKE